MNMNITFQLLFSIYHRRQVRETLWPRSSKVSASASEFNVMKLWNSVQLLLSQ